jgi:hypothetical protein
MTAIKLVTLWDSGIWSRTVQYLQIILYRAFSLVHCAGVSLHLEPFYSSHSPKGCVSKYIIRIMTPILSASSSLSHSRKLCHTKIATYFVIWSSAYGFQFLVHGYIKIIRNIVTQLAASEITSSLGAAWPRGCSSIPGSGNHFKISTQPPDRTCGAPGCLFMEWRFHALEIRLQGR